MGDQESIYTVAGAALTAGGLALAWLLYRLERHASHRRDVQGALALVKGVRRGMVETIDGDVGWAEHYFKTIYTSADDDAETLARVGGARDTILAGGWSQVFPVPTQPLEILLGSPAANGYLSDETIFVANVGLWRLEAFNLFVGMGADFHSRYLPEIAAAGTTPARRQDLANAAGAIARFLHRNAIGEAGAEGGWYTRLKTSLNKDAEALEAECGRSLFFYGRGRWTLAVGDVGMATLVLAFVVLLLTR